MKVSSSTEHVVLLTPPMASAKGPRNRFSKAESHARSGLVLRISALTLVAALFPALCNAADLWVDKNSLGGPCDDSRLRAQVGKSTPWCTLMAAGNNVIAGDVVRVREGEYTKLHSCGLCGDTAVLQVTVSGTDSAPIRFVAQPGESVTIKGTPDVPHGVQIVQTDGVSPRFVEVSGFKIVGFREACVSVADTSDITLRDLEVTGCTSGGIIAVRSPRVVVEGCRVHDNPMDDWTSAIAMWLGAEGSVIRGNFVWANTDEDYRETEGHGISIDTCGDNGDVLIENNVIWHNEGWCIVVYESNGAIVRNNTCWQNGLGRPGAGEISIRGTDASIHNNIMVSRIDAVGIQIVDTEPPSIDFSTISSDFNIVWSPYHDLVFRWPSWATGTLAEYRLQNPGGWGVHSMQVDPAIIDPDHAVFRTAKGSPSIDSGDPNNSPPNDVAGFPRPLDDDGDGVAIVDRGAFEYGGIFIDGFESGSPDSWSKSF